MAFLASDVFLRTVKFVYKLRAQFKVRITTIANMVKRAVTDGVNWQIIGLYKAKHSERDIATQLKVSKTCVHNTIKKYGHTSAVSHAPGAGRPRSTDARTDRRIVALAKKHRKVTANEIRSKIDSNVSPSTIERRLKEAGMSSKIAAAKPLLTKQNRRTRYDWGLKHRCWTKEKWGTILFSDESSFQLYSNSPVRVWRKPDEKFRPECTVPRVQKGGGSVMVWGCMSSKGLGELAFVEGNMNTDKYLEHMENYMIPSKKKLFGRRKEWIYQQDNAPCHVSKKALEWFRKRGIPVEKWPPRSPDMNPIEHIWNILARRLQKYSISTTKDLKLRLAEEWETLKKDGKLIANLVNSMPERVEALIKVKGGATKY